MNNKKLDQYIPLSIVIVIVIYGVVKLKLRQDFDLKTGELIQYVVIDEIYVAGFALGIVVVLAIFKIRFWKHLFTFILILATLGFIQFSSWTTGFNFGFLKFEFFGFFLLTLQLSFSNEPFNDLSKLFTESNRMNNEELLPNESEVNIFIKRFSEESEQNLKQIQQSDKYTNAAREAAKRLLNR